MDSPIVGAFYSLLRNRLRPWYPFDNRIADVEVLRNDFEPNFREWLKIRLKLTIATKASSLPDIGITSSV